MDWTESSLRLLLVNNLDALCLWDVEIISNERKTMNADTPRTDGFLLNTSNFMLKDEVIPFARQLERELNEAKKQLSDWQACARELVDGINCLNFASWSCCQDGFHSIDRPFCIPGRNLRSIIATFNALNQKKG